MAEKLSARSERLENLVVVLAEAQIRTEESFREVPQRFRDTDARMANSSRDLDERIGKLVSAIGELVRRNGSN
jgi:hypothetical protein